MPTLSRTLTRYERNREYEVCDFPRLRSCVKHLRRILGKCQVSRVAKRVEGYCRKRDQERVAKATVRRELITLRAAVRLAWNDEVIRYLPKIKVPKAGKSRRSALDVRECQRLLAKVPEQTDLGLFIAIALLTAARLTAIVELTWDQIDFRLKQIDFQVDDPLDRMKPRAIVPMCATLVKILRKAKARAKTNRVINFTPRSIQRYLAKAVRAVKITKKVSPHILRHTSITLMIVGISRNVTKGSANILLAGRTAGHKNFKTTEDAYAHLTVGELQPATRAVERQIYRTR